LILSSIIVYSMKTFFSAFTILLLFSLATVQAQDDDCPDGFHLVEKPPGSGNFVCEKTDIVCPGVGRRDYIDKVDYSISLNSKLF
jgi:hypothetical protein